MTRVPMPERMKDAFPVITALGGDNVTRFVGGCVRNALLGEKISDIDLATTLNPEAVITCLKKAGIKSVPTGIAHGTITAVAEGAAYEVTTLRRDVTTDGRRAKVEFTDDWLEDAKRRDFTMNALYADTVGNIFDPLTIGLRDLRRQKIVFVGDPIERIEEDRLRVLRFFRFHAVYGKGKPDASALYACQKSAPYLSELSKERITQEFVKLVIANKAAAVLTLMKENKILLSLFSSKYDEKTLAQLIKRQKENDNSDLAARLYCIGSHRIYKKHLRLPAKVLDCMETIRMAAKTLSGTLCRQSILLSLYRYGRVATLQALYIQGAKATWTDFAQKTEMPCFPVAGRDLVKAGYLPGPEVGRKLKALESAWIRSGFETVPGF